MSGYKIRKEQNAFLASLSCRRVTNDPINEAPIRNFQNSKNSILPEKLRAVWENIVAGTDKGDVAYYIITDKDNKPLLFFSLKCGELHRPMFYQRVLEEYTKARTLYDTLVNGQGPDWAWEEILKDAPGGIITQAVFDKIAENLAYRKRDYDTMENERHKEVSKKITKAKKTYSGVELVEFCKHEPADDMWRASVMKSQSMGKTLFCHFIIPLIQKVSELVGCEYVYLFAADRTREGKLMNLYRELRFFEPKYLGTTKGQYDFGCFFMCQTLARLDRMKRSFFYNYNKPKTEKKEEKPEEKSEEQSDN